MKSISSLFAKILCWFFLNLALVAAALAVSFAFQPQVNLYAIFGQQISNRLRTAGMLISHDLNQMPRAKWADVLTRHAEIQQVDFALMLADGSRFFSKEGDLPETVIARAREALGRRPPPGELPPHLFFDPQRPRENHAVDDAGDFPKKGAREALGRRPPPGELPPHLFFDPQRPRENHAVDDAGDFPKKRARKIIPPIHDDTHDQKPHLRMRTRNPNRYWTGIKIPLSLEASRPPIPGLLLAVSDSVTGNGFFFDPFPWMIVAAAIILISVLLWIPMVRNITRPLGRMTLATEEIAKGRFDVAIHEPRSDEIGRLAKAINHMKSRLSAFVKGQKRFLGDVAHELGSPIARIQFGLGALEQRVERENRNRVSDVMEDVDHLSKLVNELLAFSRAGMNTQTVRLETIDLLPVVQAAVKREITPAATIITQVDPQIRVVASAELLTRALANLVRNAVKYAGDAGPIYVSAEKRKDAVAIEVRDTGPGVSEEYLDQLFEPFFRPSPSRDRETGGVGLGLAIVKTCVETCKGTVSAHNRKPNGFAVTITLGIA